MKSKQVLKRICKQDGRKRAESLEQSEGYTLLAIMKPTGCLPIPSWTSKAFIKSRTFHGVFIPDIEYHFIGDSWSKPSMVRSSQISGGEDKIWCLWPRNFNIQRKVYVLFPNLLYFTGPSFLLATLFFAPLHFIPFLGVGGRGRGNSHHNLQLCAEHVSPQGEWQ